MWKQYELMNSKKKEDFASSPKETNRSVFKEIHEKLEEKQLTLNQSINRKTLVVICSSKLSPFEQS